MKRILDLFCKQGGAAMGYHQAGFEVVGVDIEPQPRYPFEFHQADALAFPLVGFDAIHASPPCQNYSKAQRLRGRTHPDLIAPIRDRLVTSGLPYVIENVEGAPLLGPVVLCGQAFSGLRVYRHRLFETNWGLNQPVHADHTHPLTMMGRPPIPGHFMHIVGNFSGVAEGGEAMGIDWMNREGLRESIPPAYTEWIGRQLLEHFTAWTARP